MSPCVRATQALSNLGWLYAPGSRIKDLAGDISIFNEQARPRAGVGCLIAFIRAAQTGECRVVEMEDKPRQQKYS